MDHFMDYYCGECGQYMGRKPISAAIYNSCCATADRWGSPDINGNVVINDNSLCKSCRERDLDDLDGYYYG